MNGCGSLVALQGASLLRAHGAALGASLVVLVVRHGVTERVGCVDLPQHCPLKIRSIF